MNLAAIQTALARVLTGETLNVPTVLGEIDLQAVRNFAECLRQKRIQDVRKVLPLTYQVLGDEFDRLLLPVVQGPPRAGRHRADAAALVCHLCNSPAQAPLQPAWITDLARYEMAFATAGTAGARCILRYFRFPAAAIGRAVLSGRIPARVVPRPSIGLWLRPGTTKRLMHVCKTLGGR